MVDAVPGSTLMRGYTSSPGPAARRSTIDTGSTSATPLGLSLYLLAGAHNDGLSRILHVP